MKLLASFLLTTAAALAQFPPLQQILPTDPVNTGPTKINYNNNYLFLNKPARFTGSGAPGSILYSIQGDFYFDAVGNHVYWCLTVSCASSPTWVLLAGTGGGTVTTFSAGALSPLFTTSVSTPTVTPALSFALSNFGADSIFGNFTGSSAAPSTQSLPACAADGSHALTYPSHTLTCTSITGGGGAGNNAQCTDATGSTTTYTCPTPVPVPTTLSGLLISFVPQVTNTGAATVNVAGLGVKTLKQANCSSDLAAGAIIGGSMYLFSYNGTVFCQGSGGSGFPITSPLGTISATNCSVGPTCQIDLPGTNAASDAVIQSMLQGSNSPNTCVDNGTSGGTSYKFACSTTLGAYAANQWMMLRVVTTSGASPLGSIDTLATKPMTDFAGNAIVSGQLIAGEYPVWYDGTSLKFMTLGGGGTATAYSDWIFGPMAVSATATSFPVTSPNRVQCSTFVQQSPGMIVNKIESYVQTGTGNIALAFYLPSTGALIASSSTAPAPGGAVTVFTFASPPTLTAGTMYAACYTSDQAADKFYASASAYIQDVANSGASSPNFAVYYCTNNAGGGNPQVFNASCGTQLNPTTFSAAGYPAFHRN